MQKLNRLSNAALKDLPAGIGRPSYDRSDVTPGIVHLGIGAFHRAHQAVYTEAALSAGQADWGIIGVSLRSPDTRDALAPQDGLYCVTARDDRTEKAAVIGSILDLIVAPEQPSRLMTELADPRIRIVSLTVTEKGYCRSPATGRLDIDNPDIRRDLGARDTPRTAVGLLVESLARRRRNGIPPFSVLSCDNIPSNGAMLKAMLGDYAEAAGDGDLARFIRDDVACPSTMVDRIVPATTDAARRETAARLGFEDAWPILTEPFSQWVLEDDFPTGRPQWERAGATFVSDVTPYEMMKLRLLNGSHSTLAYLGCLAGHETVSDAIRAPGFAALVADMMEREISPTLPPLPGYDLGAYRQALIARFRNTTLHHRTAQIAMDGSQKVPVRLLDTIRDRLRAGQPYRRLAFAVAAWMRYATGIDEQGGRLTVQDPLAARMEAATRGLAGAAALVDAYLGLDAIFGADLVRHPGFREELVGALDLLLSRGAADAVARFVAGDDAG